MGSIVENSAVSTMLTLMLVYRVFSAAKPILLNRFIKVTAGCLVLGVVALFLLTRLLYAIYGATAPASSSVSYVEFVSLNVTMTAIYSCGLFVAMVVMSVYIGTWCSDLNALLQKTLPYLSMDADGNPVVDLRNKAPMLIK